MSYGTNAPTGLKELNSVTGAQWSSKANVYRIRTNAAGTTTYSSSIFKGDPVIINAVSSANLGGGTIGVYAPTDTGDAAANAVPVLGILQGVSYTSPQGLPVIQDYWLLNTQVMAGTDIYAYVLDDPDMVCSIQVSTIANTLNNARFTLDKVFQNFGFGVAGGGGTLVPNNPASGIYSGTSGQSVFYLNGVFTTNATYTLATLPLKVIGYDQNAQNLAQPVSYVADATTQAFLNVQVIINNHVMRPGTLGIVVGA